MHEIDVLLGQIVPAIGAAAGAYGVAVLTTAEDQAAGATVRLGRRLLDRILNRGAGDADPAPVRAAVIELAGAAGDPDAMAALRFQLRKLLTNEPDLAAELSTLLPEGPAVQASGARAVAIGGTNSGIVATGDNATNVQRR
ncbi:hypothetical protein [Streptomyces sp. NPDC055400]